MKETLNLLPEAKKARGQRGIAFYAGLCVALYLIVVAAFWASNTMETKKLRTKIAEADGRLANLRGRLVPAVEPAAPPSEGNEIAARLGSTPPWDAILGELSVIVPEKVWLGLVDFKTEGGVYMSLKGFSKSQLDVAELIARLEGSKYFSDVEIVFSQKGDKEASFELKARVTWI